MGKTVSSLLIDKMLMILDSVHISKYLKKYLRLKSILLFIGLILSFHYIYLAWAVKFAFYPISAQIDQLFSVTSSLLFNQSVWVLQSVLDIQIATEGQTIFTNAHQSYVEVSPGCTSLKQWMHWLFLMLLFPGPKKHKLWYIPIGLIIIQFINVFRVVGLALISIPLPQHFHLFHDYFFRPLFYFFIFLLWVVWVECFVPSKKQLRNSNLRSIKK